MRILFYLVILIFVFSQSLFCATLNFTASKMNILKNVDEVEFVFTYELGEEEDIPDSFTLDLNYNDDRVLDFEVEVNNFEERKIVHKYSMAFDKAGYYDVVARYRTISTDNRGRKKVDLKKLGPLTINVANWKFTADGQLGCIESTPTIGPNNDVIYLGSEDGILYCISIEEGIEIWRFVTDGPINSTPCVSASGRVFFGSEDDFVYSLNPDGSLVWKFATQGNVYSSPAFDEEYNAVIVGSTDTYLYALNQMYLLFKGHGYAKSNDHY